MNNTEDINYPAPKQEYKVLVRCFTYNQSKYIEDALNGFAMQQTNFPFVCLVMDDASTDGEQEVIKCWMERECDMSKAEIIDIPTSAVILIPHKTNTSCTFAFYLLKQNLYGTGKKNDYVNPWREKCEYEAICEGDDYWIDSLKLQKQVVFLEKHPQHSMCYHAHKICYVHGNVEVVQMYNKNMDICPVKDLILGDADIVATNSMLYRRELYTERPSWVKNLSFGDFSLELVLAEKGYVGYLKDIMSCYRLNSLGSWNSSLTNDIKKQIKHRKERINMWNEYNKWSNYTHSYPIYKMLFYDWCRLLSLKYLDFFEIKDSILLKIGKYIYHKIK